MIQPILATPLIINWNRPNIYVQGNKTDQDTPPMQPPLHKHHVHTSLAMHCSETQQHIWILSSTPLPCRVHASNSRAEPGSSQTASQPISAAGLGLFWGSRTELKNPHFFQQRVVGHTSLQANV